MHGTERRRTIEGGMSAILAGMCGEWVGFVAFRLAQVFTDWLTSYLSSQPRFFESTPLRFLLIPPPHVWNIMVLGSAVIALIAYWIYTSEVPDSVRRKRRRIFNAVLVLIGVVVGRITNFVLDWGVLLMALHDVVQIGVTLWVMWRLIELASHLERRLRA